MKCTYTCAHTHTHTHTTSSCVLLALYGLGDVERWISDLQQQMESSR